ncbi:50S ribosomal protein L19-2, chloroplastic-like [Carica papaya]|uniref:50S ribosomal protein L19-2, chloroplastic-like n=1 Tax=Carica papaya TaxID=3649 RepID=UPI000B8CF260|nr:50S ribosomal protein L19-2, chloroplastic-like [Carica papaya]
MASQLLPQALHLIPRNPSLPSKKLELSAFTSRSRLVASKVSASRASVTLLASKFPFCIHAKTARDVVVRAESSSESEVEATEDNVEETEVEGGAELEIGAEAAEVNSEEEVKEPRKSRTRLGEIMGILNKRAIEASESVRPIPDIRTGDIVEIKLEVPENRRRLSIYKGIVMSKQNAGVHTTIRIRRIIAGIGVEIVFPLYSPNIKEIKVVSHRKVRRARLYYLREKLPRLSTFK